MLIALLALPAAAAEPAQPEASRLLAGLPQGDGKLLLAAACSGCHGLETILGAHKDAVQWRMTINDMISRGAQIFPEEVDILVAYLTEHLKP